MCENASGSAENPKCLLSKRRIQLTCHEEISIAVLLDFLYRLSRIVSNELVEKSLGEENFLGLFMNGSPINQASKRQVATMNE